MVKRLRHHPFTVVTGVRFPLESPKYGRFARPYFFGESSPCYAYCFAIRDRLFLFRARFAARHVSRLGRLIFALLHRVSLAYRQVSGVPHGAKSSKIARPILLGRVYRIDPFWYRLFIFLIIMPQPSPNQTAPRVCGQADIKNIRRRFAVGIFCRCSQLRRAYFAQGRTIDREGQYPWVLASGGVKPLRKRRRLNLVHMRAARSPKTIQACCTASPCNCF